MVYQRQEKVTFINDFSGGLVTQRSELNKMPLNSTPDSMDTYADEDGALHKRLGRTRLNSSQAGAGTKDGNGLFDFQGTLVGSFGTTYYYMEELDGTWNSLQTGMADEVIECENYIGNLIICNWAHDSAKTMQNGATSLSNLTTSVAGTGKHPKIYKDHLCVSGVQGYPYTFYYSQVSDFDDFADGGTWPVQTHNGDELTGWGELEDRLYAFKSWSIHQMTFRGGSPYWARRQITYDVGSPASRTIKTVQLKNGEQVILFLGADKRIYEFNGFDVRAVSAAFDRPNGISSICMQSLNQGALKYSHAVVDTVKKHYILYVANGGSSTMTHGLVYNYHTGACWPFSNQTLKSSAQVIDANDRRWIIAADYDGYAYKWDYGNRDHETTISSYHTTPRFLLEPGTAQEAFEVTLDLKQVSDDSVSFRHRTDYQDD